MKNRKSLILISAAVLTVCPAVSVLAQETGIVTADVLNVRGGASTEDKILGKLKEGQQVTVLGEAEEDKDWLKIDYDGKTAYVLGEYIRSSEDGEEAASGKENTDASAGEEASAENEAESSDSDKDAESAAKWDGPVLTKSAGVVMGPSGKETYYNLDMSGIVSIMRDLGNTDEYWIREDGCKMLGDYIMCAANLSVHPRGSLVESSLGTCIVCDTGGFAAANPNQLDIAVNW